MKKIQDKHIFVLYLLVFFGAAATLALMQPHMDTPPLYGNPPDEANRYLIPRFICENGTLPSGYDPAVRMSGYGFSYAFYTMLPYIIQGFAMRFVSLFTASELTLLYTARFVNVLIGGAMAAVVYGISRELFEDRRFKWMFCALVMYLPQSLFVHTYVNTDSLCMLSTAIIVYATVRIWKEGCVSWQNGGMLSTGIILCALSYYNAYGYILSSILLFPIWFFYKTEKGGISFAWKEFWKKGGFITAFVLLGVGWYFIRNGILYDGDFIGLKSMRECGAQYAPEIARMMRENTYQAKGIPLWKMLLERNYFEGLITSFICAWGSMSMLTSVWIYRAYKIILACGAAAFLFIKDKKDMDDFIKRKQGECLIAAALFCMIIPLVLCIFYSYTMDFQNQGRYIMPGIIPLMYLVTRGLEKLTDIKAFPKWVKTAGALSVIAFCVFSLLWVLFSLAIPVYLEIGKVL